MLILKIALYDDKLENGKSPNNVFYDNVSNVILRFNLF